MPPNNCDPAVTPVESTPGDDLCPKCGVEMEPIDIAVEGLPLQKLQLCPGCYLVTWSDQNGLHFRQGIPVKKGMNPTGECVEPAAEPKEC
jgi:hypothetical protein